MDNDAIRVIIFLVVSGILYDGIVDYTQRQLPSNHGITSFLVVGGVLWTLFGVLMLEGVRVFLTVLLCFAASGTPMVIGSMRRYQRERERAQ